MHFESPFFRSNSNYTFILSLFLKVVKIPVLVNVEAFLRARV